MSALAEKRPWTPYRDPASVLNPLSKRIGDPEHRNPLVEPEPCGSVAAVFDTSPEALEVLALVHRRMPGVRKLLLACEMSDSIRTLTIARIQSQHPEFDDAQIREQLAWELYGVRRQR